MSGAILYDWLGKEMLHGLIKIMHASPIDYQKVTNYRLLDFWRMGEREVSVIYVARQMGISKTCKVATKSDEASTPAL